MRSAISTTGPWSAAISITESYPRKSGACSMNMCSAWLSIHSPQYRSRRIAWISGVVTAPAIDSMASTDAVW